MLLTKSVISFLNSNRTPQIHTLLLLTPTGKLLSSSSPNPASTLRAQATLAASLWALYSPLLSNGTVEESLPRQDTDTSSAAARRDTDPDISSILIQLENGTMVIRALHCSLLFVAIGPSPNSSSSNMTSTSSYQQTLSQGLEYLSMTATSPPSSARSPAGSGGSFVNGDAVLERRLERGLHLGHGHPGDSHLLVPSSAASDAGSTSTVGGGSVRVLKRQAEELAKWLDGEMEGFVLGPAL